IPQTGQGLAAAEASIEAACTTNPCATGSTGSTAPQAGKVIYVPTAARMTGQVRNPLDGNRVVDGAAVQAVPAVYGALKCDRGMDASACNAQTAGVLDLSLAQDAFVPRPASGVVQENGKFVLQDLDCGECTG